MSREKTAREAREENYFIPMTDLLVGILFIFIIVIMAIMINIYDLENMNKDELERNAGLLEQINRLKSKNSDLMQELKKLNALLEGIRAEMQALHADNEDLKGQLTQEKAAHLQDMTALQQQINIFLAQSESIRKELLLQIQQRLTKAGYPSHVDVENGVLRLADNVLFDSGEYELTERGRAALDVLAQILEDVLPDYTWKQGQDLHYQCARRSCLEAIYVEGHTDKKPIQRNLKGGIRSNLELSSARANQTFQTFAAHEKLNNFVNGRGEKLLGVCGYGESRPVKTGTSEEDLRANRRIDLRFLMSAPRFEGVLLPAQQKVSERLDNGFTLR